MKCSFCGEDLKNPDKDQDICENCKYSVEELSNGKGDDEDDEDE